MTALEEKTNKKAPGGSAWREFPWWLVAIIIFLITMGILIATQPEFKRAFLFIKGGFGSLEDFPDVVALIGKGISVTVYTTLVGFAFALVFGLLAGLGRISSNVILRNTAIFYVEFIRGVPTLVLIFTVAFVLVPWIAGGENSGVSMSSRAVFALAIIYGAFLAEIFRAGIES
ncbi:MAG: ABC transporter permease subunit, partial [Anaerolineales bacterium]|nr:ABC transporter permease subunit [Anaerolineales bacterium]